jgi:opacity protein-like surface antigen
MRMKRVLLATTALASLAGATQAQAGDLYLSVFGGANFLADSGGVAVIDELGCCGSDSANISSDADTGFVIGGVIGKRLDNWAKNLRVELEASYRRNDLGGNWITTTSFSTGGVIDGNMSTFAIMANAWYDIDVGSKFRPYVGGGIGWGRMDGEIALITTFTSEGPSSGLRTTDTQSDSGFVWQLGLGVNYEVMPDVDVGLDYRYFRGPNFRDLFFGGKSTGLDNESHGVSARLTIGINAP